MVKSTSHPPMHWIIFGDPGSRKTTALTTWPKPMCVFVFDPLGKDMPYLKAAKERNWTVTDMLEIDTGGLMTPCRQILDSKGNVKIQLEYYHDAALNKRETNAYKRFLSRMSYIHTEYDQWRTIAIDSVTFMELCARMYAEYVLNPDAKDPRQWYGESKNALERILMVRFGALPTNVVVLAHTSEDKDELNGTFVRGIHAVGKLGKHLPGGFSEVYRAYIDKTTGKYLFQTRSSGLWVAATQIGAPDPCEQHYEALWTGGE